MSNFERALADALAGKERLERLMSNPQYRADTEKIKSFINKETAFRYIGVSVEKGDKTIIKLRAKEQT